MASSGATLDAISEIFFTKGKLAILLRAVASTLCMHTWLSHLEVLIMVTAPARRTLSTYLANTGRSVLSMAILYRMRLSIARWDKNSSGLLTEKAEPFLFLNSTIYRLNCD